MVKAFGCNSYGLDLSSARAGHARSDGVTVLNRTDLGRYRFDFINADWVFEHIPNPLETLIDLKKTLKEDGLVGISVPLVGDTERRLKIMNWNAPKESKDSLNPIAPLEHINCFRRETLLRLAALAGMREIHMPVCRRFQLANRLATARRIIQNLILPVLPDLRRDYATLVDNANSR
jgi:SAM-dependent methyltransferase